MEGGQAPSDNQLYTSLLQALKSTTENNNDLRQQAETYIKQANAGPQQTLNTIAAVQLGTVVEHNWKFNAENREKSQREGFEFTVFDEVDKQEVRAHILHCLYRTYNKKIIKQYMRSITTMARHDYPNKWGSLLTDVLTYLNQQEEKSILTGLQGLYALCQKYEYESEEEREPLVQIVNSTFGILGNLINQLIGFEENETALQVLHLICKIFYVSNQLYVSPFLAEGTNIEPWIQFFKTIMDRPIPAAKFEELEKFNEDMDVIEKRDASVHWKIKGRASQITYRLFAKYGDTTAADKNYKEFSKHFVNNCSLPLLESHMQAVFKRKTQFVGSKSLTFALKFISQAIKIEMTMAKLQPYVENLLYETVIPIMMLSHKDVTLYQEDPIEYIRKGFDFTESIFASKHQAVDLIEYLCSYKSSKKKKSPPDYLHKFLQFCVQNLQQYQQQANPDFRIKEAILLAIGSLESFIFRDKDLKGQMEQMLKTHVLPELSNTSPNGHFLICRACWMYGEFGYFKFQDQEHVKMVADRMYQLLVFHSDLPVRMAVATSMYLLLETNPGFSDILRPALKQILEVYLKLMQEIDSEELVDGLQGFVGHFESEIPPFALQLAGELVAAYQRLIEADGDDDNDEESTFAACSVVSTIRRILDAVQENKEILPQLEALILPILMHGLTQDGMEAIDDSLDCIAILLYNGPKDQISPALWKLFPQLLYVICGDDNDEEGGYAFEHLAQISVSLSNYIAKDVVTFLAPNGAGPDANGNPQSYIQLTFHFLKRVFQINKDSKHLQDGIVAMKIIVVMLENLQGKIDQAIPILLQMIAQCLNEINGKVVATNYRSMLLQTISMFFWHNTLLTFQVLEENNWTVLFFQQWLQGMALFKKEFELRRVIFGLASILKINVQNLPAIVAQRLPDLTKQLTVVCLEVQKERLKNLKDNEEWVAKGGKDSDDENDSSEEEEEIGEGEEMQDSEEEYEKTLHQIKKVKDKKENDDGDDSDDSDYEYAGGDLGLYDSVLEEVDELLFVKEILTQISTADMNYYMNLMNLMSQEEAGTFNECMQNAEAMKAREEEVRKGAEAIEKAKKTQK